MKRLLLLILIVFFCIAGFLFAGGVFSLPPDSGLESVTSLLFNSRVSEIISVVFIAVLAIILYRQELSSFFQALYIKILVKPVYREAYAEPELVQKVEMAEQKMTDTEHALNKFSQAIEKYALHLSSHTGAIQGLNAASHELHKGAAAQNRVLMHLMENLDKPLNTGKTPHWRIDPPPLELEKSTPPETDPRPVIHPDIPEIGKSSIPPGCARKPRKKPEKPPTIEPDSVENTPSEPPPEMVIDSESLHNVQKTVDEIRARQGKAQSRQNRAAEALAAEEEILRAIRNLNAQLDESEFQE